MRAWMYLLVGALGGASLAIGIYNYAPGSVAEEVDADAPIYWVAPMDPQYRRDQPGKSPMGMDLVPVYAEAAPRAGVVKISPDVVNNLGVRTGRAHRADWHTTIRTVGYVSYDQDRLVHIHPRVAGWVETLHVKAAGNPVVAEQPLYELYSPELVNAQEEFLLAQKRDNKPLIDATYARLRALQMSESFIETLGKTAVVRQTVTFRAGQSGVVDNLAIREGFYVQPGTTMMSIGTLDEVWVEAEVFARQAALLRAGLPVAMTLDYIPGRQWKGQVDYVYPTLDPQLRTARVRLRFNNKDGDLKPNMFVNVVIQTDSVPGVLSVPREAVIRTGAQNRVVLVLGEGRYKSVAVELGQVDEQRVEILAGLKEGAEVVVSAQFLLDSESSKTSDFKRMMHSDMNASEGQGND